MNELGRVLDPDELRSEDKAVGRLTVDVLDDWLRDGEEIEIVVPTRVVCARCEGGGCDACGRSGAFRLDLDEAARTVAITLPRKPEAKTVAVRLVRPFGSNATIDQLWIELRASEKASASCRKVIAASPSLVRITNPIAIALFFAIVIVLAVLLAGRR
jgi:hypothetical protein